MLPKVTAAPGNRLVIERPVAIVEGAPDPLPSIEPAETVMELSTVESAESHILITEAATSDSESSGWKKTSFGDLCPEASDELLTEIDRLNGTDSNARVATLESLGSRAAEAKAALPAIYACLSDESESVRVHAACALWTITSSPSETVPALETVLGGADPDSVALACYLLGEIGDEASPAIQKLAGLQNHTCVEVRIHAAEALLKITGGGSGSAIVLTNSLADCDEQERCLVAVALGSAKGEDRNVAIETLITCLEDPQPSVRAASALSLGGFGPYASKAARPLQQAATSDDAEIRQAAETALACIKK
jgi:HEAT repeat protein